MATPPPAPKAKGPGGKILGLPTPLVIAAAIVAAYYLYTRYKAGQAANAAAGTSTTGTDLTGAGSPNAIGGAAGGGAGGLAASSGFTDNTSWYQSASAALQAAGADALSVQQALTDFLNGQPLSSTEAGIVRTALSDVGPPPTPLSVILAQTTPGVTPSPNPTPSGAGESGGADTGPVPYPAVGPGTGSTGTTATTPGATGTPPPAPIVGVPPNLGAVPAALIPGSTAFPGGPAFPTPGYPQGGGPTIGLVPAGQGSDLATVPGELATPAGGYTAVVGNIPVGVLPSWQAANNAAIAAGKPIPYPHGGPY